MQLTNLTDDHTDLRFHRCKWKLGGAQENITEEQAYDVVSLAPPVKHVIAGGQQRTSGKGGGEKNGAQSKSYGVQDEPDVCRRFLRYCRWNVAVAGNYARRIWNKQTSFKYR